MRLHRLAAAILAAALLAFALPGGPAHAQGAAGALAEWAKSCNLEEVVTTLATDESCREAGLLRAVVSARRECAALRQCKTDCRGVKKEERRTARADKKVCNAACDSLEDRKARRDCRAMCRGEFRGDKKDARAAVQSCKNACRSSPQIYTDACEGARSDILAALPQAGACAVSVVRAACAAEAAAEQAADDAAADEQAGQ